MSSLKGRFVGCLSLLYLWLAVHVPAPLLLLVFRSFLFVLFFMYLFLQVWFNACYTHGVLLPSRAGQCLRAARQSPLQSSCGLAMLTIVSILSHHTAEGEWITLVYRMLQLEH